MAIRKGWDALKADYRQRLESKGITRERYDRGESLKPGRGHEHTPESPKRIPKDRTIIDRDYSDYMRRRDALVRRLAELKREKWQDTPPSKKHGPRWDADRSLDNIIRYGPTMKLLQWAVDMLEDEREGELIDALRDDPETYAFLGYH